MKFSSQIKPISYLKAHAAEIVRNLSVQGQPLVITQNGEAKDLARNNFPIWSADPSRLASLLSPYLCQTNRVKSALPSGRLRTRN